MKPAALIIDLQNGFIGEDSPFNLAGIPQLLGAVESMVARLRSRNIPIVWTRVYLDEWADSPYAELWPDHFSNGEATFLKRGTKSFDFVPAVQRLVRPEDIIIDKPRYSAFIRTELESRLQQMDVTHLLFAGTTTNVCVESTLRDAFQRDFNCTLVSDCTLTFSDELQAHAEQVVSFVFGKVRALEECLPRQARSL